MPPATYADLEAKDFLSRINSAWLFEIAELEKMTISRSASEFKAWLTFHEDKYVEKHEKVAIPHPRRSVMFGTTNEDEVLTVPNRSSTLLGLPRDERGRASVDRRKP